MSPGPWARPAEPAGSACGRAVPGPGWAGPRSTPAAGWARSRSPPPGLGPGPPAVSLIGRELGVDHIVAAVALRRSGRRALRARGRAEAVIDLLELAGELTEPGQGRLLLDGLPGVGHQVVRSRPLVDGDRVAALGQQPLDPVGGCVAGRAGVGQLAQAAVLVTVLLGVADHPLDLGLVQVGGLADRDPLLGAGAAVRGRAVQVPVP